MKGENLRGKRVAGLLLREISEIIQSRVQDHHVGFTTVMHVQMSPDQRYAKVFVSVLGDAKSKTQTLRALNNAGGFIQYELSKRVELRYMPHLSFHLDESLEHATHINAVLEDLRRKGEL